MFVSFRFPNGSLTSVFTLFVYLIFPLFAVQQVLERSQSVFEGFLKSGTASKSWFAIFSLLQRLRQACDHVSLTVGRREMETTETTMMTTAAHLPHCKGGSSDGLSGGAEAAPSGGDGGRTGAVDDNVSKINALR